MKDIPEKQNQMSSNPSNSIENTSSPTISDLNPAKICFRNTGEERLSIDVDKFEQNDQQSSKLEQT